METFSSAVIGIGNIGKRHAEMQRDTGRLNVRALCDPNEALKAWAAEAFPEAMFYTSVDDMLANESLDLVSVVTPHNTHAELAIKLVGTGANVITEKPMATSFEDCQAMVAASKANNRFVTVFHNRRTDPWLQAAQSVVDEGLLGQVIEINTGINYGPTPATWRGYKEPSGGLQFDWGAHLVDYCLMLHPTEIESVSGYLYRLPTTPADQVEDHAVVRILFTDGVLANVTSSAKATVQPHRFRIVGERGTLVDEWNWNADAKAQATLKLAAGNQVEMSVPYPTQRTQDYYDNVAAHMYGEAELDVTAESAARVINVLCTAERSAAEGGRPLPLA